MALGYVRNPIQPFLQPIGQATVQFCSIADDEAGSQRTTETLSEVTQVRMSDVRSGQYSRLIVTSSGHREQKAMHVYRPPN